MSGTQINLERIDFLLTKLLTEGEGLDGPEYHEFQTLVGGRPAVVAAFVYAVKAAQKMAAHEPPPGYWTAQAAWAGLLVALEPFSTTEKTQQTTIVETAEPSVTGILCGVSEGSCACVLAAGHVGPHECDCGGSWELVGGKFVIFAFPESDGAYPGGRTAFTADDLWSSPASDSCLSGSEETE